MAAGAGLAEASLAEGRFGILRSSGRFAANGEPQKNHAAGSTTHHTRSPADVPF
jgi:hypothetical protein